MDYLDEVFGKGGCFASHFPEYETRAGQVALSRMIDKAVREGCHALGEGPCGTGKAVAYGIPAVWHAHHSDKRAVIATANIALQEQLVKKDLPLLSRVLPWKFTFALLKGRNNYLCLNCLRDTEAKGELVFLSDEEQNRQAQYILSWARTTETGDVSELPFMPMPRLWSNVSTSTDECKGDACSFRSDCFAARARRIADEADIVVTNFHLLFAHVAVRMHTGLDLVLPKFDLLIMDEAHEAADIARDFFGFSVSEYTFTRFAKRAIELGNPKLSDRLRACGKDLFGRIADYATSPGYKSRLKRRGFVEIGDAVKELRILIALANVVEADETRDKEIRATAKNTARLADTAAERIREAVFQSDIDSVYWIEMNDRGRPSLKAKPIGVSETLRESLFEPTESVIMVSATLTTDQSFEFIRGELGVPAGAVELKVESPFNFRAQALFVAPEGLPDPRTPEFPEVAAHAFKRVVDICDGRTLGLFTSYRVLNIVHQRIQDPNHRILRQGEMPRSELTRIFKEDIRSVLLGTDSFWTGVDVPGEALTAVVIDKLPFPNLDDPLVSAICERDKGAFFNYLVPKAIIRFRQGAGRLIRSQRDIGVIVVLDNRIASKPYGRRFLKSLPTMFGTRNIENIGQFLEEAAHARAS